MEPRPFPPGLATRRVLLLGAVLLLAAAPAAPAAAAPPTDAEVRQVIDEVVAIRGIAETAPIPWSVASRATALERQLAELDAPDARAVLAAEGLVYTRLGLLPPGTDLHALVRTALGEQVAGFYDTETRSLTVLDDDGTFDVLDRIVLAHEAVHALQDMRWDLQEGLDAIPPDAVDRALAYRALVEGDASLGMLLWGTKHAAADLADTAGGPGLPDDATLAALPPVVGQQLLSPYVDGLGFLFRAFGAGGWPAVDATWESPPVSMEQVLHPELHPDHLPIPVALPDDLAARLGPGWTERARLTLGELIAAVWFADGAPFPALALGLGPRPLPGGAAAAGWGGDRIVALDGPDGAYALAWRTTWDTAADAAEAAAAAQAALADLPGAHVVTEADPGVPELAHPVRIL
ncbi:MAG: hypothetical protein ACKOTZ_09025, partial [Chloroflexota bacterium]